VCVKINPMDNISFSDFQKLDLRVGEIKEVSEIPGLDEILKLQVDLGEELGERTLLAGLKRFITPGALVGRQIIVVTNLEPKTIRGEVSEGMLLAADAKGRPVLVTTLERVVPGSKVR